MINNIDNLYIEIKQMLDGIKSKKEYFSSKREEFEIAKLYGSEFEEIIERIFTLYTIKSDEENNIVSIYEVMNSDQIAFLYQMIDKLAPKNWEGKRSVYYSVARGAQTRDMTDSHIKLLNYFIEVYEECFVKTIIKIDEDEFEINLNELDFNDEIIKEIKKVMLSQKKQQNEIDSLVEQFSKLKTAIAELRLERKEEKSIELRKEILECLRTFIPFFDKGVAGIRLISATKKALPWNKK